MTNSTPESKHTCSVPVGPLQTNQCAATAFLKKEKSVTTEIKTTVTLVPTLARQPGVAMGSSRMEKSAMKARETIITVHVHSLVEKHAAEMAFSNLERNATMVIKTTPTVAPDSASSHIAEMT